jgi:hypothetical protein
MNKLFDQDPETPDSRLAAPEAEPSSPVIGRSMRVALASMSASAAVIHFAMIPSHAEESAVQAVGFAIAGWMGLLLALAIAVRPRRSVLLATGVTHLAFLAIWIVSRTAGLPFGIHDGHPEDFTSIDILANVMSGAVAIGCAAALGWPRLGARLGSAGDVAAGVLAGAGMIAASVVLASPDARDHAQHSHGDEVAASAAATTRTGAETERHSHETATEVAEGSAEPTEPAGGASSASTAVEDDHDHGTASPASATGVDLSTRCDLGFNPVAFWEETTIVNGGAAGRYRGSAALDQLIRLTTAPGAEAKDAQLVAGLGDVDDATYADWLNWLPSYMASHGAHDDIGAPDDNAGHGGHIGPQPWVPMTDQSECDALAAELERAKAVALRYPTSADAEAAGWVRVTGYVPGIAAHYMNFRYVDGEFNVDQPEMLLYDGTGPNASIVGLSYYLLHESEFEPSQGFTGPNDHFHRHIGLCVGGGGVLGDSNTSAEECAARGGTKSLGSGGWMNHVWIVPGCESPWGLFSGATPVLENSLGAASGTAGGCSGSAVRDRYDLSPATADNVPGVLVARPDGI